MKYLMILFLEKYKATIIFIDENYEKMKTFTKIADPCSEGNDQVTFYYYDEKIKGNGSIIEAEEKATNC